MQSRTRDECSCKTAGYCPRYIREIAGRQYSICQGTSGLDAAIEQSYRDIWRDQAKSKGLGDTVAKLIRRLFRGVFARTPNCGCKKRQNWLNKWFPYFWKSSREHGANTARTNEIDPQKLITAIHKSPEMQPVECPTCEEMIELTRKPNPPRQVTITIPIKQVLK